MPVRIHYGFLILTQMRELTMLPCRLINQSTLWKTLKSRRIDAYTFTLQDPLVTTNRGFDCNYFQIASVTNAWELHSAGPPFSAAIYRVWSEWRRRYDAMVSSGVDSIEVLNHALTKCGLWYRNSCFTWIPPLRLLRHANLIGWLLLGATGRRQQSA